MINMGCCGTVNRCFLFGDDFNRPDETINSHEVVISDCHVGFQDSVFHWVIQRSGEWSINSHTLKKDGATASGNYAIWRPSPRTTRNFSLTVKVKIIGDDPDHPSGESGIGILSDLPNVCGGGWAYALRFFAASPDSANPCGYLVFSDFDGSYISDFVPVPNAKGGLWHTIRLCYDSDTKILRGSVKLADEEDYGYGVTIGKTYWDHMFDVETDPTEGGFAAFPYLTCKSGTFYFDDFRADDSSTGNYGYGYGYDYGYGSNHCPCCGPCAAEPGPVDFTKPENDGKTGNDIDCRIVSSDHQTSGELVLSSGLTWAGGYSGVDDACKKDETAAVAAGIRATDYGATIDVSIGANTATVTFNSAPSTPDGSITFASGSDPVTGLDLPPGGYLLGAALIGDDFIVGLNASFGVDHAATTGDVTISLSSTTVNVLNLQVIHCMFLNADSFFRDIIGVEPGEPSDCGPCRFPAGSLPATLVVTIEGIPDPSPFGSQTFNGASIVTRTGSDLFTCKWDVSWIIAPGITHGVIYKVTVLISFDTMLGIAYIFVFLNYQEFGEVVNTSGQSEFYKQVPLDGDGKIDCHELLGNVPYQGFTIAPVPGADQATVTVEI